MSSGLDTSVITTDHGAYAARRAAERARMIPIRRARRVEVGDRLACTFESTDTLTYQVQEMVFTERLTAPGDVHDEVDRYARMLPGPHSLVATMFLELTDPKTIRAELARLEGLQRAISIKVGTAGSEYVVAAEEVPGPDEDPDAPGALVSVHVLRFTFGDAARDAFRDPSVPASLVVEHPQYAGSAPISGATRTALLADLTLHG